MIPEPINPYAPPEAFDQGTGLNGSPRRWGEVVIRALAVVAGFSLLADPSSVPGINSAIAGAVGGVVLARLVGLGLMVQAFLPWRPNKWAGNGSAPSPSDQEVEEL